MSVRETLELDISDALSAIEEVGQNLANVAESFGELLSESLQAALDDLPILTPEIDAESVSSEMEQALEAATSEEQIVNVDADVSEVEAALDEIDDSIDIEVSADTSDAQSSIDELAASSIEVSVGLEQATDAASEFGGASDFAAGAAGGLAATLGRAGPVGIATAAALVAVTGGLTTFYNAGRDSIAAVDNFYGSLGDLGEQIVDLQSGTTGFNTDLRSLAQLVGSSDEAVLQSIQRFAQWQQATGATGDEVVRMSQEVSVLAAQIRVNNPAVGEMDQVINALTRSIGRGGPRLRAYGIDLDSISIEERAAEMFGLKTEFTDAEKAAAGLTLANEQLAPSFDKVSEGAEGVQVTLERVEEKIGDTIEELGKPFVAPINDVLEELALLFEQVGFAVAPLIGLIVDELTPAISGATRVVRVANTALTFLNDLFENINLSARDAAQAAILTESAIQGITRAALNAIPGLGPLINFLISIGAISGDAVYNLENYMEAQKDLDSAIRNTGVSEAEATRITDQFYLSMQRTRNEVAAANQQFVIAYEELGRFAETARASIPAVTSAFSDLNAESNADILSGNLQRQIQLTDDWTSNMARLYEQGYDDIAGLLAELGPEQSALLVEQYAGREGELEKHLEEVAAAHQRANAKVNEIAVRGYLDLRGITEEQANAIVLQLGASLQLGVPAQSAIDALIDAPSTRQLEVVAKWRALGSDSAGAVGENLNAETGKRTTYDFLLGMEKGLAERTFTVVDSARRAADAVVNTVNGIFGNSSPSKVMEQSGRDLVAGLVLGIGGSAPDAERAMAGLANDVLGVSLSAGAPSIRDVSVTVPVTVSGGMTAEQGREIGSEAGRAAAVELQRMLRTEARLL